MRRLEVYNPSVKSDVPLQLTARDLDAVILSAQFRSHAAIFKLFEFVYREFDPGVRSALLKSGLAEMQGALKHSNAALNLIIDKLEKLGGGTIPYRSDRAANSAASATLSVAASASPRSEPSNSVAEDGGDLMTVEDDLRAAELAAVEARTDTKITRLEGKDPMFWPRDLLESWMAWRIICQMPTNTTVILAEFLLGPSLAQLSP